MIIDYIDQFRGLHGPGGPRAGPGPGLEIIVFKRAGPGLNADGPGRAGPEIRGKSPNSKSKRYVLRPAYRVKIPCQKLFLKCVPIMRFSLSADIR